MLKTQPSNTGQPKLRRKKPEQDRIAEEKAAAAKPAEPEKKGRGPGSNGARRRLLHGDHRRSTPCPESSRSAGLDASRAAFQATEGRLPKDHDEFMKKVVTPLEINLGYKEENQEFLYDPKGRRQLGSCTSSRRSLPAAPAGAAPTSPRQVAWPECRARQALPSGVRALPTLSVTIVIRRKTRRDSSVARDQRRLLLRNRQHRLSARAGS